MTPDRTLHDAPHTLAAEAAMRSETTMADQARRTKAFGRHRAAAASRVPATPRTENAETRSEAQATSGTRTGIVLTVSDRCSAGEREDTSGPLAAQLLGEYGLETQVRVIPDGEASVREAIGQALAAGARLVFTTGGTGIGPRDRTPEGTEPWIDLDLPGLAQAIRDEGTYGDEGVLAAVLSRGLAGVVVPGPGCPAGALIVNAPGSPGGVRDAVTALGPLLDHVLDQIAGGDH